MTDAASADFTATVEAAYQAARKTYGDQRYEEGVKDGKAKAAADAETTGVRLAIEFLEEFASAAVDELRKRYGIEDPNAEQPTQLDSVEPESPQVVELVVADAVATLQPQEPIVVEPETGLSMEVPALAVPTTLDTVFETATSPIEDSTEGATDENITKTVVRASDDDALSILDLNERMAPSGLALHFANIGELCKTPDEETLASLYRIGGKIAADTVLALEAVGRWLGDVK